MNTKSTTLLGVVRDALCKHLVGAARVRLGLSGGLDSVVLLHLLGRLQRENAFGLSAMHVHHGLSPDADAWAAHCQALCLQIGVPCEVVRVTVDRQHTQGLEGAARIERYRALSVPGADILVTAHHQDDQAETVLLALLRGGGMRAAAAMPGARGRSGMYHLRPLLDVPRSELEAYAREHYLTWVDDESNFDTVFRRNALRHAVFPVLEKHFPDYRRRVAVAAASFAEAAALLDQLAEQDASFDAAGGMSCERLAALDEARARNALAWFIRRAGVPPPPPRRLREALRQLLGAAPQSQPAISLGQASLRRYHRHVFVVPDVPILGQARWIWHGEAVLPLTGSPLQLKFEPTSGQGLRQAKLAGRVVSVRLRQGGERLALHRGGPARSLKNLFQEAGVPPWWRSLWPLLWVDETLVAVPGVGVHPDWQAQGDEAGLRILAEEGAAS